MTFASNFFKKKITKLQYPRLKTRLSFVNYEEPLKWHLTPDVILFNHGSDITYNSRRDIFTNMRQLTSSKRFGTADGNSKSSTVGTTHLILGYQNASEADPGPKKDIQ